MDFVVNFLNLGIKIGFYVLFSCWVMVKDCKLGRSLILVFFFLYFDFLIDKVCILFVCVVDIKVIRNIIFYVKKF